MKKKVDHELHSLKRKIDDSLFEIKKSTGQYLNILSSEIDNGTIKLEDNIYDKSYWNDIGNMFLRYASYSDAEEVYNHMIHIIKTKEKTPGEYNKGLAYYQYGISKIVQKNYDEGVPYILDAIKEDIKKVGIDKSNSLYASKFNTEIMLNLEEILDKQYIPNIKINYNAIRDKSNVLVNKLNESEKMFFYKILIFPDYIDFKQDIYTKNFLFNRLRELCLLFEHILRKYANANGTIGDLTSNAFRSESWYSAYNSNRKTFNTIIEFDTLLNSYLSTTFSSEDLFISTIISQTHLLRNYLSHYYDQYPILLSNKSLYEECMKRIIYGVIYAMHML